jgi:hypothetical protein
MAATPYSHRSPQLGAVAGAAALAMAAHQMVVLAAVQRRHQEVVITQVAQAYQAKETMVVQALLCQA